MDLKSRIKKYGTIYTPEFVVEKVVDLAFKYYKGNILESTICEPACGTGNFLVHLYKRLMSNSKSQQLSEHILTKVLWGYEILADNIEICKENLYSLHGNKIDLNIFHGNTICVPEDTTQQWYSERSNDEGGLLSEDLRVKKFDVIVGNPPYTHLRNLNNRRYHTYPKQRDMAQVFVRWALDHLTEKGVISFNTTDKWLNSKINDGAIETRHCVYHKLVSVCYNNDIKTYSTDDGGSNTTMVFVILNNHDNDIIQINDIPVKTDIFRCNWLNNFMFSYNFQHITIEKYINHIGEIEGSINGTSLDNSTLLINISGDIYRLLIDKMISRPGQFKIIKINNIRELNKYKIGTSGKSEIKFTNELSQGHALWLLGYFNTIESLKYYKGFTTELAGGKCWRISAFSFKEALVPDYDYYKTNYPERHTNFLNWVGNNMRDKKSFLAGIDEQFEKLIGKKA